MTLFSMSHGTKGASINMNNINFRDLLPIQISVFCSTVVSFSPAAAAKSLQSCPTLRPHRRQPTRLPHPWDSPGKNTGVSCHFLLQCRKVKSESEVAQSVRLLTTLWTVASQPLLSMGFSRQEYWSGLPCHPPGNLPHPGIKPASLKSPALAGRFYTTSTTWEDPNNP